MDGIRDKAAIVGIGQTPFAKGLGRTEFDMAVEAIHAACEDAGLSPHDIDGVVRFDMESTDEEKLLSILSPELGYHVGTPLWRWRSGLGARAPPRPRWPLGWRVTWSSSALGPAASSPYMGVDPTKGAASGSASPPSFPTSISGRSRTGW